MITRDQLLRWRPLLFHYNSVKAVPIIRSSSLWSTSELTRRTASHRDRVLPLRPHRQAAQCLSDVVASNLDKDSIPALLNLPASNRPRHRPHTDVHCPAPAVPLRRNVPCRERGANAPVDRLVTNSTQGAASAILCREISTGER